MTTFARAIIRAYASGTHKADIQPLGSLPNIITSVPVATDIPAAEVVVGRECAVLFFDDNPDNAVVITIHGAVPAAAGAVTSIQDADNDTKVQTEASADEDKVRITVFATERGLFQTATPHVTLTGDVQINSGYMAIAGAPDTQSYITLGDNSPVSNKIGLHIRFGGQVSPPSGSGALGVGGYSVVSDASGTQSATGLLFYAGMKLYSLTAARAVDASLVGIKSTGTPVMTNGYVYYARSPLQIGSCTYTTIYQYFAQTIAPTVVGTYRYPFYDQGTAESGDNIANVFKTATQFFSTTVALGGGKGVMGIADANTVPSTNPAGGGVLYSQAGALKWRGSGGTVTTIAPA